MSAEVARPIQGQLEAYNARDLDAFLRCYSSDVTLHLSNGTHVLTGIEKLRERCSVQFGDTWAPCLLVARLVAGQWVIDDEVLLTSDQERRRNVVAYHVRDGLIDQAVGLL